MSPDILDQRNGNRSIATKAPTAPKPEGGPARCFPERAATALSVPIVPTLQAEMLDYQPEAMLGFIVVGADKRAANASCSLA